MKFQCENDPEWLKTCSIEPVGVNFSVKLPSSLIAAFIEVEHALYIAIRSEYERRQAEKK